MLGRVEPSVRTAVAEQGDAGRRRGESNEARRAGHKAGGCAVLRHVEPARRPAVAAQVAALRRRSAVFEPARRPAVATQVGY